MSRDAPLGTPGAQPAQSSASAGAADGSPRLLQLPNLNDVLVGELAARANWIVANVQTNNYWPVNAQKVLYRGETIWILPLARNHFPAVAMQCAAGRDRAECERLMMRFISNLSWVQDSGMLVEYFTGGSLPVPMGRDKSFGFTVCDEFHLSYFPEPSNEKALLALALMREGRGLNHPAYAFLSFYRVLEVAFPNGKARSEWMGKRTGSLSDHRAKEAIASLQALRLIECAEHALAPQIEGI